MDINYYLTYDLPVPYKSIKVYPAIMRDYLFFNTYAQCLLLDKNSIPDPKIISMNNLEYIFYMTQKEMEKHPYLLWFDRLLSVCLKDDKSFEDVAESIKRYKYDANKNPVFYIQDKEYTSEDFEEIKKIIAQQNLVELIDENISKDVRDSLEKAKEYKSKLVGKPATLEDYIISLAAITGWSFDYIYSMSIRKFTKSIKRLDNFIHYKIYLSASMSGMVEFKDKSFIKHWLTNLDEEDRYEDVSLDLEKVQDKISLESAKR